MDKPQELTLLIPIPAGKTEHFRQVAKEATSERLDNHRRSRHRQGVTKEMAWIHSTPRGDMLVVYLEIVGDLQRGIKEVVESQEPHDVWFREQILASLDLDLSKGSPPFGELAFDWRAN